MSKEKNNGGPAFPTTVYGTTEYSGQPTVDTYEGMSLRDWFAGQALAGIMSNESTPFSADHAEVDPREIAGAVYELADAMLKAREAS